MRPRFRLSDTPLTTLVVITTVGTKMAAASSEKEKQTQEYLKNHRLMELFENLTAHLIYERPGEFVI